MSRIKPTAKANSRSKRLSVPGPAESARRNRRWLLLGGLAGAILALSTAVWVGWRRGEMHLAAQEAILIAQHARFSDAEPKLRSALENDPENVELLKTLALGLIGTEQLDAAEQVLDAWCDVEPAATEPYRLRMNVRHRRAQRLKAGAEQQRLLELAVADGQRVIELEPTDDSSAQKIIFLCLGMGRLEEADRICREYLKRHPDDPWLLYLQARVCYGKGESSEAQALLERLPSAGSKFPRALMLRAILYYEADQPERAIPLLRKVIAEDPASQPEARYHLVVALGRAGHTEEAQRVLTEVECDNLEKEIANIGPMNSLAIRVRRAELLFGIGRAEEALAALQTVLSDDPGNANAHRQLASYYSKQGQSAKAAEHRQRAGP